MDLLSKHGVGGVPIRATSQLVLTPTTTDIVKPNGNYTKGFKVVGEPNLVAANLVAGKNYFGIAGGATIESLGGRKAQIGNVTFTGNYNIVSLPFHPTIAIVQYQSYILFYMEVFGNTVYGRCYSGNVDNYYWMTVYSNTIQIRQITLNNGDNLNYIAIE